MNRIGLFATMIAFALAATARADDEIGRLILNDGMPPQAARPLAPDVLNAGDVVATDQVGDLERALEGQVREVVSGILPNGRYAAYVHITLTSDGARLRAYQQEMELASLPGLPAPDAISGRSPMA